MINKKLLSFDRGALRYLQSGQPERGGILKAVRAECKDKTVLLVSHRKSTMAAADISSSVESGRLS